jgi:hypothetical protein
MSTRWVIPDILVFITVDNSTSGLLVSVDIIDPVVSGFATGFVNYKKGCTRLAAASDKVDMIYKICLLLKFTVPKYCKILLKIGLSCLGHLGFVLPKTFELFGFPNIWLWTTRWRLFRRHNMHRTDDYIYFCPYTNIWFEVLQRYFDVISCKKM